MKNCIKKNVRYIIASLILVFVLAAPLTGQDGNGIQPERSIEYHPAAPMVGQTITFSSINFITQSVDWDFGDGTVIPGGNRTVVHQFMSPGTYRVSAKDTPIDHIPVTIVISISRDKSKIDDQVELQAAEILLDNGKLYKAVPKNSKSTRALLRMKINGTGTLAGYWLVDGQPFEFFNHLVNEGELKEIYTSTFPGLPTTVEGVHTISLRLTQPTELAVTLPELKYYVLPQEIGVQIQSPVNGFVAKEDTIPGFSWSSAIGAVGYRIAFSNALYPLLTQGLGLVWHEAGTELKFSPTAAIWKGIKRNRWTYWKVRAIGSDGKVVAESDVHEIKVVITTADIKIKKVTDMAGRLISMAGGNQVHSSADSVLVHGSIRYMGDSEFIVLRVYLDDKMTDQLVFRDVKKGRQLDFETFLPHRKKTSRVLFDVLKTSSPAVSIGIKELILKK